MDDMIKCMWKVLQINIPRHLVPLSSKERFNIFQLIIPLLPPFSWVLFPVKVGSCFQLRRTQLETSW